MADTVADITKTSGPTVWRGIMLRFKDRDHNYVQLNRLGKNTQKIGFSARELFELRDLVEELIQEDREYMA